MEQKTAQQKAEERIPWDQATTDAVGLSCDGFHNARDIARAAYATCIREEVEPRDRLIQELVDALANVSKESEDIGTIVCNCGAAATGIQLATNSALAKAKEQFGIEPSKLK